MKVKLPSMGPCRFCGHYWFIRKESVPERCASCKRRNWAGKQKKEKA